MERLEHRLTTSPACAVEVVDVGVDALAIRPTVPALLRLIAEVRDGDCPSVEGYNRSYHRHNR